MRMLKAASAAARLTRRVDRTLFPPGACTPASRRRLRPRSASCSARIGSRKGMTIRGTSHSTPSPVSPRAALRSLISIRATAASVPASVSPRRSFAPGMIRGSPSRMSRTWAASFSSGRSCSLDRGSAYFTPSPVRPARRNGSSRSISASSSDAARRVTHRLYYTNSYLAAFTSTVAAESDDRRRVYLDETAFYPTSGGQPHDLGTLGGVEVVDVVDEGERIAHLLSEPLSTPAQPVAGVIDWTRRFDHMQQHTGQHLLSAVFEDLFRYKTVSVHFGPDASTLDLDAELVTRDQMITVEERAN